MNMYKTYPEYTMYMYIYNILIYFTQHILADTSYINPFDCNVSLFAQFSCEI